MREIRVTVPPPDESKIARVALENGIGEVAVQEAYVHGPNQRKVIVSVSVSTPRAKAFLDALFATDWFDPAQHSVTSRELRAIAGRDPLQVLTRPMIAPALDVLEDLWQLSYVTPSYAARAGGAAVLLADGMIENSPIAIVVAALFLPFLSEVLACSFGLWAGHRGLVRQGALALGVSTLISIAAGMAVTLLRASPMGFTDFKGPLPSFGISAVIGIAAGLASADDAGRRYLIGVAAAVQYAIFPVWVGYCCVRGFPDLATVGLRIASFAVNVVTIGGLAALVYSWTGMRKEDAHRLRHKIE